MTLEQILIFLPSAFLLGASPGANNLLAFTSAAKSGWRRAAKAIIGRLAAWAVLVVLVSYGLDAVLRMSEIAFVALKWLGVGYLVYLARQFWIADSAARVELPEDRALMRQEFLTLMANPKAYLLLTAFLPQFLTGAGPVTLQLFALGGLYVLAEALAALLWIGAGAAMGARALTPLRRRIVNRISAGLMGTAAIVLARSEKAG